MNKLWMCAIVLLLLGACTSEEPVPESKEEGSATAAAEGPTNRIDIPPAVVNNLGIKFAEVERLRVDKTLRMPGAFEAPPNAERIYRMPLGGRIDLKVAQYERIEQGAVLAEIDSPEWRSMQQELDALDAEATNLAAEHTQAQAEYTQADESLKFYPQRIATYEPQFVALASHMSKLEAALDLWVARVAELEGLVAKGAGRAGDLAAAKAEAAAAEAAISDETEKRAELEREKANLEIEQQLAAVALPALKAGVAAALGKVEAAKRSFDLRLRSAAAQLDMKVEKLKDDAWRTLDTILVTATAPGVILDLHVRQGELLESGESLFQVLDDSIVRFRARALQADLGKLATGLSARVVAPSGGTLQGAPAINGTIRVAPKADADARLVDIIFVSEAIMPWARPGVSAELEVVWDESSEPELAVPTRAVIRDGLTPIIFVRDLWDKNKVIRMEADISRSNGHWTSLFTGVMEGQEVVVEGNYELKLTGAGKAQVDGHFHADGTFHAGKHSDDE